MDIDNHLPEFYKPEVHEKKWGRELWIRNCDKYCGKILQFNKGAKFSLHFHNKEESWYINGLFTMIYIDTTNATKKERNLFPGDVVHLYPLIPHQIIALEKGEIFEVSDQHFENDSRRIEKGDSQL